MSSTKNEKEKEKEKSIRSLGNICAQKRLRSSPFGHLQTKKGIPFVVDRKRKYKGKEVRRCYEFRRLQTFQRPVRPDPIRSDPFPVLSPVRVSLNITNSYRTMKRRERKSFVRSFDRRTRV